MKEKIYIDTDIILDLLLKRESFYRAASGIFSLLEKGELEGCVSPLIFANLFYILRKLKSGPEALKILQKLKVLVRVLPIDEKTIEMALASDFKDFEDAIQSYSALENGVKVIITRNLKDYSLSALAVFTAEEYLKVRQAQKGVQ
jgi:predicted nucleic acid-binding protein